MSKRPLLLLDKVPTIPPLPKGMNANVTKFLEKLDKEYLVVGLKSTLTLLQSDQVPKMV